VTIHEPAATYRYVIHAVRTYPKSTGIPAEAFDRVGRARLVLITCGRPFDPLTGNYGTTSSPTPYRAVETLMPYRVIDTDRPRSLVRSARLVGGS
jgi:hypothetical protein